MWQSYFVCSDFTPVSDPTTVLKKFCGNSVPIQVVSTSNHLRFTFHSDNTTNAKGFFLEYGLYLPTGNGSLSSQDQSGGSLVPFIAVIFYASPKVP